MPWLFQDGSRTTEMDTELPYQPLSQAEKFDWVFIQDFQELETFTSSFFEPLKNVQLWEGY
jgi:hypothetical protein